MQGLQQACPYERLAPKYCWRSFVITPDKHWLNDACSVDTPPSMAPRYELVVGLDKGHKTTPNTLKKKPSRSKGKVTNRNKLIRDLVREVAGFSPYERRAMELLR